MDDDRDEYLDLDIDDLFDVMDEMFPDGYVVMPNGAALCLCGRDPRSDQVITQTAKAAALIVEYDLCLDACLSDAAAAYDRIRKDLKTGAARRLRGCMQAAREIVEVNVMDDADDNEPIIIPGSRSAH